MERSRSQIKYSFRSQNITVLDWIILQRRNSRRFPKFLEGREGERERWKGKRAARGKGKRGEGREEEVKVIQKIGDIIS